MPIEVSYAKDVTGPGITSSIGMEGTDLGIVRRDPDRGCLVLCFGDSFERVGLEGRWCSPTLACYDDEFHLLGVPAVSREGRPIIDPDGPMRQLWEYPHNNPVFSTVLPTDLIRIGDWWYIHVMVTNGLYDPNVPGSGEKWTEFQRSRDLVNWGHTGKLIVPADPIGTMLTFDVFGEWVYVMGTGGLARDKPIFLWRNPVADFPHGQWTPWGWKPVAGWRWGQQATPILAGRYGELCLRNAGGALLSFFDAGRHEVAALIQEDVLGNWYEARRTVIATAREFPQLYGGYSSPSGGFTVSQWNTRTNDPYKVMLFR